MAEPIIVTTPDGQEFEFPAGTSQDVMKSAMQKHFGKPPESMFGVKLPDQQQFDGMMANAQQRVVDRDAQLSKVGARVREARMADPENIGWTPGGATDAQLGAEKLGKWDGAFLGFGDEVVGIFNPEKGKARGELKDYARQYYPKEFMEGEVYGGSVNALATAPATAPRALQLARFAPRALQPSAAGATSAVAWDTAHQIGTGEGSALERIQKIDTDRTKTAGAVGGVLGTALGILSPAASRNAEEFSLVLEGVVDQGAVSPDGLRALERFLKNKGVPLNDVTLRSINTAIEDAGQTSSKALALPVRIKDILVDALDDGTGKVRDAIETQLRGTMVQKGPGATTVGKAIDEDISASRIALDENYGQVLGKKARIKSEDQTKERLAEIGREGYEPILSQPLTYQGARSLDEVLSGPGINKLKSPLEEIAAGEGLSLEDMIKSDPLRAAHWMQSRARQLAESSTDTVKSEAFRALRGRLLGAINEAAPGYDKIRRQYGDEFGNIQALEFGDKFLSQSRDAFQIDKMKRAFSDLSPRQKNIALLSVRDALRSASGRGRRGAAPRLTQVGDEQVLDSLEYVFGKRGARVAQGIEEVGEFVASRQRIDPRRGSPTASNQEASRAASENVQSSLRRKVGKGLQSLAGDVAYTSAGFGPINIMRRGLGKAGETISGGAERRINAFAELLEAPIRRAQQRAATQRAAPMKGPDGKFISTAKARELGLIDDGGDAIAQPATAKPKANAFGGAATPTLTGAAVGGLNPDLNQDGEVSWAERMAGIAGGAVLGNRAGRFDRGLPVRGAPMGIPGRTRKDVMRGVAKENPTFEVAQRPQPRRAPSATQQEVFPNTPTRFGRLAPLVIAAGGIGLPAAPIIYSNMKSREYKNRPNAFNSVMSAASNAERSANGLPYTPSQKPDLSAAKEQARERFVADFMRQPMPKETEDGVPLSYQGDRALIFAGGTWKLAPEIYQPANRLAMAQQEAMRAIP